METVNFNSNFFAENRARLRTLFSGTAPIVLTANGLMQRSSDVNLKYVQDSSFWYLTGIEIADVILVMDKGKEYLILPHRESWQDISEGAISIEELIRVSGVSTVLSEEEGWKTLKSRLKRVKHIATFAAPQSYFVSYGMYTNPARATLISKIKSINPNIDLLDLREHAMRLRVIKQSIEIEAITCAINITIDTLKEITKPSKFIKYTHENQLEADINRGFRFRGADGNAFDTIVASGSHATTVHHPVKNDPIQNNSMVLMDVGAEVSHYAADISRTVAYGKINSRQKKVHAAVLDVQDYGLSLLKPGVILSEFENIMEHYMGEKLRELGLIKSISHESVRKYFTHRTSHFLGLDTHDAGDYQKPLEPNMVLTCEPGIYIPEEGLGVRIEDDLVITEDSNQVLSGRLFRGLE